MSPDQIDLPLSVGHGVIPRRQTVSDQAGVLDRIPGSHNVMVRPDLVSYAAQAEDRSLFFVIEVRTV